MKKTLPILALAGAALLVTNATASTLTWNFGANTALATAAFTSGTAPTGVTVGSFTIGNTNGSLTAITNTSASNFAYANASAGDNLGNAFRTGTLNTASGGSGYYSITITTTNLPTLDYLVLSDFDFGARSTGTGPANYALRSSADGFATDIFTGTMPTSGNAAFKNNSFADFKVKATSGVEFRLYGYGGAGAAGASTANNRIDDVSITITAVPEPATYGIIIGGAIGLLAFARSQRLKRRAS